MKLGILSRKESLYSTSAPSKKPVSNVVTKYMSSIRCVAIMDITSHHPEIHYKGEKLEGFDAIIPRIGALYHLLTVRAVVRQFEMIGVYSLNESVAISRSTR